MPLYRGASPTRVSVATQLVSQVLPSSSENACSKRIDVGVTSEMTKRTRIRRPLNVSLLKNSPRPFLNWPTAGAVSVPSDELAKLRRPSSGLAVVQAQAQASEVSSRAGSFELDKISATTPNGSHDGCAIHLDPSGGPG